MKKLIQEIIPEAKENISIYGLSCHSNLIEKGDAFVALPGEKSHGNDFIASAIKQGAHAIITDREVECNIPVYVVKDLENKISSIANKFYENPSSRLNLIGITGTNGKSTIAYLLSYFLSELGSKSAMIGTLGVGEYNNLRESDLTTPAIIDNINIINYFYNNDIKNVTMEVSSIGITKQRVDGLNFNAGIFTNLSEDHLDFHGNLENYFLAKSKLFTDFNLEHSIINIDDSFGKKLLNLPVKGKIITYGLKSGDFKADNIVHFDTGMDFTINHHGNKTNISTNLIGEYNISNLLAIFSYLIQMDYPKEKIASLCKNLPNIPGRMQHVCRANIDVYVDYSHTPDSLKQALTTIKNITKGRVICVFGCGGDRQASKRQVMGHIASEIADMVIITDDNPRTEDPSNIVNDILSGIIARDKVEVINSRNDAINKAIELASPLDSILIAGKGHEKYQIYGNSKLPFDDYEVVLDYIKNKN